MQSSGIFFLQERLRGLKWSAVHPLLFPTNENKEEFSVKPQLRQQDGVAVSRSMLAWVGTKKHAGWVQCISQRSATTKSELKPITFKADAKRVDLVAFSDLHPQLLATGGREGAKVWDIPRPSSTGNGMKGTPKVKVHLKNKVTVKHLAWNPAVDNVITLVASKAVQVWDCEKNQSLITCRLNGSVTHAEWNRLGQNLMISEIFQASEFKVKVFDPRGNRLAAAVRVPGSPGENGNVVSSWQSEESMVVLTQDISGVRLRVWDIRRAASGPFAETSINAFSKSDCPVFLYQEKDNNQYHLNNNRCYVSAALDETSSKFILSPASVFENDTNIISRGWAPRKVIKPSKGEIARGFLISETSTLIPYSVSVSRSIAIKQLDELQQLQEKDEQNTQKPARSLSSWWPEYNDADGTRLLRVHPERSSSSLRHVTQITPQMMVTGSEEIIDRTSPQNIRSSSQQMGFQLPGRATAANRNGPAVRAGVKQSRNIGTALEGVDGASLFASGDIMNSIQPVSKPISLAGNYQGPNRASFDREQLRSELERIDRMDTEELLTFARADELHECRKKLKEQHVITRPMPVRPRTVPSIKHFDRAVVGPKQQGAKQLPRVMKLGTSGKESRTYPENIDDEISIEHEILSSRSFFDLNDDFFPNDKVNAIESRVLREHLRCKVEEEANGCNIPYSLLSNLLELSQHNIKMIRFLQQKNDEQRQQLDRMYDTVRTVDSVLRHVAPRHPISRRIGQEEQKERYFNPEKDPDG